MFEPRVKLDRLKRDASRYDDAPIPEGGIVFYGSSGFTRWGAYNTDYGIRPLEEDIPGCVNRGFGGATAEEPLYYYPRLSVP